MDYKQEYIQLKKALSALKRGNPSDWELQILQCSIDEFWHVNQYLAANEFNVKERAQFIKRLEKHGCDLFDAFYILSELHAVRREIDLKPDDNFLLAKEMILGNMLYRSDLTDTFPSVDRNILT